MKQENNSSTNQQACHYLTFNTADWVDIFIRPSYKQIIANTLNEFITDKRLTVYAWCLMSNHLHLMLQAKDGVGLSLIERDFKKITTNRLLENIEMSSDLRRDWMRERFALFSNSLKKIEKFTLWQNCSNPAFVDFRQPVKVREQLAHIHDNPVRDRIVELPEQYVYSSARDYKGEKGLVNVKVIDMEGLIRSLVKS